MKDVSRREMEVMELISESMTNEEIAQKLFLSAKTVKTHIRNIFKKQASATESRPSFSISAISRSRNLMIDLLLNTRHPLMFRANNLLYY